MYLNTSEPISISISTKNSRTMPRSTEMGAMNNIFGVASPSATGITVTARPKARDLSQMLASMALSNTLPMTRLKSARPQGWGP